MRHVPVQSYTIDAAEGFWHVHPGHYCWHSKEVQKNVCVNDFAPCNAYVCSECGHGNFQCDCVPDTFKRPLTKQETVETLDNQSTDDDSEEKFDSQRTEEEMPRVVSTSHASTTATNSNRGNFRINHGLQGPR